MSMNIPVHKIQDKYCTLFLECKKTAALGRLSFFLLGGGITVSLMSCGEMKHVNRKRTGKSMYASYEKIKCSLFDKCAVKSQSTSTHIFT